jgi:hypothetical protein
MGGMPGGMEAMMAKVSGMPGGMEAMMAAMQRGGGGGGGGGAMFEEDDDDGARGDGAGLRCGELGPRRAARRQGACRGEAHACSCPSPARAQPPPPPPHAHGPELVEGTNFEETADAAEA